MHTSAPLPSVSALDRLDRVLLRRVDGVRRAEVDFAHSSFLGVEVDGDDRAGTDEARAGDRRVPDATAAEHRDGVVALDARPC